MCVYHTRIPGANSRASTVALRMTALGFSATGADSVAGKVTLPEHHDFMNTPKLGYSRFIVHQNAKVLDCMHHFWVYTHVLKNICLFIDTIWYNTCTHTCVYTLCIHTHTYTYIYIQIYANIPKLIHRLIHKLSQTDTSTDICTFIYIHMSCAIHFSMWSE